MPLRGESTLTHDEILELADEIESSINAAASEFNVGQTDADRTDEELRKFKILVEMALAGAD